MRIYNPYENKKKRIENDINICITKSYYKFLKMRRNIIEKGIKKQTNNRFDNDYGFFQHSMKYGEKYMLNENEELIITSMVISEVISIEKLQELKIGFRKILSKYKPYSFLALNRIENLERFIRDVNGKYSSEQFVEVGMIELPKEHKFAELIKYIRINLQTFTAAYLVINLHIEFSNKCNEKLKKILNTDYSNVVKLFINKNSKILSSSSVGISMEPSEVHRQMDIQNLFLSIKWSILNLLAVDIPFYFYNNKIISPSIEYFQIKNMFENCNKRKATILENIGVNAAIASGVWDQSKQTNKIYEEYYRTGINSNSIKIITDIDKMNDNQKKEFEIIKDYVYRELIIPVVISTIVNDIYNTLGTNKAKVFRSSKSKIKYGELFKVRLEIEENNVLLRSLENDINYNRFDSIINDIKDCLNIDSDNNVVNNLFNRSINDLENIKRDIKLNKEMLDDIISLLNIKSNRKGQNITIALTIITVILTAITIWISIKTVGS